MSGGRGDGRLRALSLLVDPGWAAMIVHEDDEGRPVRQDAYEEWDDFGSAVAHAAGPDVRYSRRAHPARDPVGLLYVRPVDSPMWDGGSWPQGLYGRALLLGTTDSPREARRLDALGPVGAIPRGQYQAWRGYRDDCLPIGLWGLTAVGAAIGARPESSFMATDRYCVLDAEGVLPNFTALVGAYLAAYAQQI